MQEVLSKKSMNFSVVRESDSILLDSAGTIEIISKMVDPVDARVARRSQRVGVGRLDVVDGETRAAQAVDVALQRDRHDLQRSTQDAVVGPSGVRREDYSACIVAQEVLG